MQKSDKTFLASQGIGLASQIPSMVYQFNLSKQQKEEADKLKKELDATDITYTRPDEISQNVNSAKMLANQGLPSAQRQAAEQDIMRTQNFAVNAASERGGGLNAISNIQQSTGDMYRNLASMDAQQRLQNIQNLQNQQALAATYADKEYELNVYQPFMRKLQSMQDLKGASIQNRMGALNQNSQLAQQIASAGLQASGQGMGYSGGGQSSGGFPSYTPMYAHTEMTRPIQ